MFAFIKGQLVYSSPVNIVIEANGIGYKIFIPANVFSKLPHHGEVVFLHVSYVVRELSQTLYGFLSVQERDLFELLMGVTGIGPKLALSLIGHMILHDLRKAISNAEITVICKVPGIGKKTAERLIIELRDKIPATFSNDPSEHAILLSDSKSQHVKDAMSALINLGYTQITAQKAIKKTMKDLPEEIDLATLITHSLKNV
jgi:Holliday junction DNA helicase RuvA